MIPVHKLLMIYYIIDNNVHTSSVLPLASERKVKRTHET